jgi:hypothetical protein
MQKGVLKYITIFGHVNELHMIQFMLSPWFMSGFGSISCSVSFTGHAKFGQEHGPSALGKPIARDTR